MIIMIGLHFYNARHYDSSLGRIVEADTIVPNPSDNRSFDRFSYGFGYPYADADYSFYNGHFDENGTLFADKNNPKDKPSKIVHELGHIWDYRSDRKLSRGLQVVVGGVYEYFGGRLVSENRLFGWINKNNWWQSCRVNIESPFPNNAPYNHLEDFAVTFTKFVIAIGNLKQERKDYIKQQIRGLK